MATAGRRATSPTWGNAVGAMLCALHCEDDRAFGQVFNVAYGRSTGRLEGFQKLVRIAETFK